MWNKWKKNQKALFKAGKEAYDIDGFSKEELKELQLKWINARLLKRSKKASEKLKKTEAPNLKISSVMKNSNLPKSIYSSKLDVKPAPTSYNSTLGTKVIAGKTVDAPVYDWSGWSFRYEKFEVEDEYGNITLVPPKINSLELRILHLMELHNKLLLLVFRGSRKSTNGMRFAKRKILDFGWSVCYGSGDVDLVVDYAIAIRQEFMENKEILNDYGYILDDRAKNTQTKMFWLSQRQSAGREPGLSVVTSPSSTKGKSRIGGHPRLIMFDDIISDEVEGSAKMLKKISKWFWKAVRPMMKANTKFIVIGTMKDPEDIYAELEDRDTFHVEKIPAIYIYPNRGQEEPLYKPEKGKWYYVRNKRSKWAGVAGLVGGEVGFDEYNEDLWGWDGRVQYYLNDKPKNGYDGIRMSMQEFLLIRHEMGMTYFEYEYQLNAIPLTKGYLKWEAVKYFKPAELNLHKNIHLQQNCHAFLDQAFGFRNEADLNCLGVMSESAGNFYLHDLWAWTGGGVNKKIQMIKAMADKYTDSKRPNTTFIKNIYIEADVTQTQDATEIKQALSFNEDGTKYLPIEAYRQSGEKKAGKREIGSHKVVYQLPDDINPKKRSKIIRILNEVDVPMQMGRIFMSTELSAKRELNMSKTFPYCKKLDPLDVLGSLMHICKTRGKPRVRAIAR